MAITWWSKQVFEEMATVWWIAHQYVQALHGLQRGLMVNDGRDCICLSALFRPCCAMPLVHAEKR
jgi:hypothetical protein